MTATNTQSAAQNLYTIKKFDMSQLSKDATVCIIGRRRSGKSFLVRDMMYHLKDLPKGIVISRTESASPFFRDFIPDSFIYDSFSEPLISSIVERQKKRIRMSGKKPSHRMFLIMDDCLSEGPKWRNSEAIRELFMNGRHLQLAFIITLQYVMGLPPDLRGNVDYCFIYKDGLVKNRKKLYENYGGNIPDFETFCNLMDRCTDNYMCLVIHISNQSNKLEDSVFWYRAEDRKPFHVGASQFWEHHNSRYDPGHIDRMTSSTLNLIQHSSSPPSGSARIFIEE